MKRAGVRDDKNATESQQSSQTNNDDYEKDRKIKRLTQINRQLIETLKQQNQELTKKIQKQRNKAGRSLSVKSAPKNSKQLESIRKQLSNAYKQIDMYKQIVQNLKAKEVSLDHVDKIYELQNRVKEEDSIIENYQKELKYLAALKEKQEKDLKVYQNEEAKQNKLMLQKQITGMKEKLKALKKNANKRQQIQKRQHAYFVQLERSLRRMNDEYYPGKADPKKQTEEEQISQVEWASVKSRLAHLQKLYDQNNKKLDTINRQKLRQLKSYEQNELKLKQKTRKLNMLRSRIAELTKLTIMKELPRQPKQQQILPKKQQIKNDKNKIGGDDRQVKKWNVPEAFCLQKGKVLPNSYFSSDKQVLDTQHKYKIVEAHIYVNGTGVPCLLHFLYQNQTDQLIQGKDILQNIPPNLEMKTFKMKQKDYIWHISGTFKQGVLNSITLKSKLGSEAVYEDQNSKNDGEQFSFFSKPNDIPSCFFVAVINTGLNTVQFKICYLGFQFMSDW